MDNAPTHRPDEPRRRGSWLTLPVTLMAVLGIGLFLLMLPGNIGVAIVTGLGLLIVVATGHYLVWGWWLGRMVREEAESNEDANT